MTLTRSPKSGIPRGQVTEVCGPPGVGKTALAMQLTANTLRAGNSVVWVDTGAPLPGERLKEMLESSQSAAVDGSSDKKPPYSTSSAPSPYAASQNDKTTDDLLGNVCYLSVYTLAHLLVLFLHPTTDFPPQGTSLIVIDNVSAPLTTAFPNKSTITSADARSIDNARRSRPQWSTSRKWAIAGDLGTAMSKLAALKDVAIVVINQFATSIKGVSKAVLKPAVSGLAWEAAVQNQILLLRDFCPEEFCDGKRRPNVRFATLARVRGRKTVPGKSHGDSVPYVIEKNGLREMNPSTAVLPAPSLARLGATTVATSTSTIAERTTTRAKMQATSQTPAVVDLTTTITTTIKSPTSTVTKRKATEIADSEDDQSTEGGQDDDALLLLLDDAKTEINKEAEAEARAEVEKENREEDQPDQVGAGAGAREQDYEAATVDAGAAEEVQQSDASMSSTEQEEE